MRFLFIIIAALCFLPSTQAQMDSYKSLNIFLETDFFREYLKLRESAEKSVLDFKQKQDKYSPEDIQAVTDAYNTSAEYFNQVLQNIKQDMLNKEKRGYIIKFPGDYSKQVECDLYRAKDFYQSEFQTTVMEVTGSDTGTGITLALIASIFSYGKQAFDVLLTIKEEIRKFNDALLERYLIEPYHFRNWDEIN